MIKPSYQRDSLSKPYCSSRGFTLLELMVVIVIVGIMFSFLALSIRSSSPEETIKKESQRLHHLIQLALEEAVLRGEEYAILFKPNSYQFVHLTDLGWQPIENDRMFRRRELPLDISIELEVEKNDVVFVPEDKEEKLEPQVFLMSSGEITPEFTLDMFIFGVSTSYRLAGKMNGHIINSDNAE